MSQTKLELQEQMQADSLKAFTEKSMAIQAEIRTLEAKLKDIQAIFDEQFTAKTEEIKKLENDLRIKLSEANDNGIKVSQALSEADLKLESVKKLEKDLQDKHIAHKALVDGHNLAADEKIKELSLRESVCVSRETESQAKLADAFRRLEIVLEQERRNEVSSLNLVHIAQNTNDDIVKLNELRKQTNLMLEELELKKTDIAELQKTVDESRKENEQLRSDLDIATHRLANRKVELDKKEFDLNALSTTLTIKENQLKNLQNELTQRSANIADLQLKLNAQAVNQEKAV